MARFEGMVSYSYLPKPEKGNNNVYQFDDDYSGSVWTEPQDKSICPIWLKVDEEFRLSPVILLTGDMILVMMSIVDSSMQNGLYPEVNLKIEECVEWVSCNCNWA
ncbi:hypothetical protein V6N13_144866 [Hibiscus sabdariffa]|uniref:Uncharacterized protein n=1 Tax=Hibiscus sabdariffa TaxID=183260 RepID=A0ABR2FM96_9ROSI